MLTMLKPKRARAPDRHHTAAAAAVISLHKAKKLARTANATSRHGKTPSGKPTHARQRQHGMMTGSSCLLEGLQLGSLPLRKASACSNNCTLLPERLATRLNAIPPMFFDKPP
jgi:hypothetical protein